MYKEYKDRMASINKKYKALMKMGSMTVSMQVGSSSAKQTKQNFIWVDSATRDAGDMEEAVGLLPEIFGEGKYGTSGVLSRGGKQNFKAEECVWKRLSKDGKHYRIIQHSTGYFYQKGFLPSDRPTPRSKMRMRGRRRSMRARASPRARATGARRRSSAPIQEEEGRQGSSGICQGT